MSASLKRAPLRARTASSIVLGVLLLASVAGVRTARGSLFAQDGWGWWWDTGEMAARGRGGTSVAVTGFGATGEVNPAATALTDVSYAFFSYAGEVSDAKGSAPGEEGGFRQRSDLIPHVGGVFVLPGGLRGSGLFRAQSDASYERHQSLDSDAAGPYSVKAEGSGGLSRVQVGVSDAALGKRLLWGLSIGRVQGVLKEGFTLDFESASERDLRQFIETRLRGAWVGSGGFVFQPDPRIAFGVSGTTAGRSRIEQETNVVQGSAYRAVVKGWQHLPGQWAGGLRLSPAPRLSLTADFIRTQWSDAKLNPAPGSSSHPFHDTSAWGMGLEYAVGQAEKDRWILRSGISGSDYHVRTAESGEAVKEWVVSLGAGRKVAAGRATFDLCLEYGNRGDRTKVGAEERFVRVGVGLSFASALREY